MQEQATVLLGRLYYALIIRSIMLTKQKLKKFAATFFWQKKIKQEIKFLYDILVTFYVFLPWIFLSTLGPSGGGRSPTSTPPWLRA